LAVARVGGTLGAPTRIHDTRPLLLALVAAAAVPAEGRAAPTAICHCFKDRSFDPAKPAAADPYILATTRSSLLSAALGPGKGSLVKAVMGGTAPDDLWVAHWAGARTGQGGDALLAAKEAKGSWRAALAGSKDLGAAFDRALASSASDAALAALAVDDVLVGRVGASPEELALLRAAGARSEEVVLAALLSVRLRTPAMPILARVRSGAGTWGTALRDAGLAPQDMDGMVRGLVR
jgi:hypothetical protein